MALEQFCAACTYLDPNTGDIYGKFYCETKCERHLATDPKCGRYCEAYGRSNSTRQNMFENSKSHQSSGCYITTIICEKMGLPDNNRFLNTLRKFRDEMKQNPMDLPLLVQYDQVGPYIAEALRNDINGNNIAYAMFKNYILPAVEYILDNNKQQAKDTYILMTNHLANYYGISTNIVIPENIDKESLGHGRTKVRKPQTNY